MGSRPRSDFFTREKSLAPTATRTPDRPVSSLVATPTIGISEVHTIFVYSGYVGSGFLLRKLLCE